MKTVVPLLLLLLPCALHAAQWEVAPSNDPNTAVSIDVSSIEVNDYIVNGWVKFDYQAPREYQGKQLSQETSHRLVNCEERTFWVIEGYGQAADGADQVRIHSDAEYWTNPAPDSKDEAAYLALCKQGQSFLGKAIDKVIDKLGY